MPPDGSARPGGRRDAPGRLLESPAWGGVPVLMRTPLARMIGLLGLSSALLSCGGFFNEPLQTAAAQGRVIGADPAFGWVNVLGRPDLHSPLQSDGRFKLTGVPAQRLELLVVASRTHASLLPVTPHGARVVDLGDVLPLPGAFVLVQVTEPGGLPLAGTRISVEGTLYEQLPVDATGRLRLGPLANGCYTVVAELNGFEDVEEDVCLVSEQELPLSIELPLSESRQGCHLTGCEDPLMCAPTGSCVECLRNDDCEEGKTCLNSQCQP